MISFDPFYLLLLIFFTNLLPGVILSFSLLKDKNLFFVEKLFIGFAIGLVIPPLIIFALALLGVTYSFSIAIFSVVLFYLFAVFYMYKTKPWENYKESITLSINQNRVLSLALLLVLFLSFWIRMQSYSPIFFDLDPYYYLYSTTQILKFGIPPFDDKTAWYPDLVINHRVVPILSYLEAMWYSFYTSGGEYNNYLLALVASVYPPIMAMLSLFFLYLLVSVIYKREFGIIAAAVAMSIPMFLIKLAASEFEMQAYGFFALSFFFAFYALCLKEREIIYALLASLTVGAAYLGSGTIVIITTALMIFIPLHSVLLFFKREKEELLMFSKFNLIIFAGFILSTGMFSAYRAESLFNFGGAQYLFFLTILFSLLLYVVKDKIKDINKVYNYLVALLLIFLAIFAFTPLGEMFTGIVRSSLGAAEFLTPLSRTIQEQGIAGEDLSGSLGFMGVKFSEPFSYLFVLFSSFSNLMLKLPIEIASNLFNSQIPFYEKVNSPIMVIFFFSVVMLISSFYRESKGATTLAILYLAIIFPASFIGLLKSKFTIYTGFLFSIAFGILLGELLIITPAILKRLKKEEAKIKEHTKTVFYALLLIGILFSILQFSYSDFSPAILFSSLQPRFQDNPMALQSKFEELCDHFTSYGQYDETVEAVCLASEDPLGYASRGTNYQYNQILCMYSLMSGYSLTAFERNAVEFRCLRINDYWIETMEWIKDNPDESMRVTSWWDYGHWTNYFGEKNSVLRNEHASQIMIGEVAHDYLDGTPQELKEFMLAHDSKYALFDSELLMTATVPGLGGKYGALNYLSCARDNDTDESKSYMESACEWEHIWEIVYIPKTQEYYQECTISPLTGKKGVTVFRQEFIVDSYGNVSVSASPSYCLGQTTLADGSEVNALYYLEQKYESGDLKLNKAYLFPAGSDDLFNVYHLLYTKDLIWVENGEIKSGWEDRKGKFYDSNLYSAFFLKELEGFELVFVSANEEIKIYKIKE